MIHVNTARQWCLSWQDEVKLNFFACRIYDFLGVRTPIGILQTWKFLGISIFFNRKFVSKSRHVWSRFLFQGKKITVILLEKSLDRILSFRIFYLEMQPVDFAFSKRNFIFVHILCHKWINNLPSKVTLENQNRKLKI